MARSERIVVKVLHDFLDMAGSVPDRPTTVSDADLRHAQGQGVGDGLAGRVEQAIVKPGVEVILLPTHTVSNP